MDKRTFLKVSSFAGAGIIATPLVSTLIGCGQTPEAEGHTATPVPTTFSLPELGFAHDALEPSIDAQTMRIHHGKHHAGYVRKLNAALEGHALQGQPLETILAQIGNADTGLRNNGGGHFNHAMFWKILTPGGEKAPSGLLAQRVEKAFGNQANMNAALTQAAGKRFGSGWAWLVQDHNDPERLFVTSTANQDNPLMTNITDAASQGRPILGIDVWEHAYYLNYQNRRPDYIAAFFNVIDWNAISERFAAARG